jgi:nucleoprotein TPR
MKRLIAIMEDREKQAKDIVEKIETQWASMGEKTGKREAELQQQIEREGRLREEAEKRVENLETVIHRMGRGELPLPGTPFRTPGGADGLDGMMGLSPTVALASKSQRGGKTFTEVYADYVRLQAEYNSKCLEHEQMERTLTNVLAEIEERVCLVITLREQVD